MDRRRFLGHGTALLPVVLAGCAGDLSSPEETSTTDSTTSVQPSSTTNETSTITGDGHEDYLIVNKTSSKQTVTVTISPASDDKEPLVDATYEAPAEYVLEFPDLLEHGQRYYFEATDSQGKSDTSTQTIEGCANAQYGQGGDQPMVVYISKKGPNHLFLGCDMQLLEPQKPAEEYKVSE